ncbi:MAG: hypothetical protein LIQ31_14540 [Planctomycetes bacterium]|nr:hypothetical protein [Planctomycetota bacterium]
MNPYYTIFLLLFLIVLAVVFVRYVQNTVDREFRHLARAVSDEEFRRAEIARMDKLLAPVLPLPDDVRPLPGKQRVRGGVVPPVLLALRVILLWGGGSVPRDKQIWYYGGMLTLVLAAGIMLLTMRRRRWSRTARYLLFRADLKRLDNDRAGSAADLRSLLRLTPWDDSAWAELSDDLAALGQLQGAIDAMEQASRLDPAYDEYRMITASLAIRANLLDAAREAIRKWTELDNVPQGDPRLAIYTAALQLAEGHRDDALAEIRKVLLGHETGDLDFLDDDQALAGVRDLLPGRE